MSEAEQVVLDASAMVDVLVRNDRTDAVVQRISATVLHVPTHFDVEVLSALGRLQRGGLLTSDEVVTALGRLSRAPLTRHHVVNLTMGAWDRRAALRLTDALYVELAEQYGMPLITTDGRLARAYPGAEDLCAAPEPETLG
ncbi:ribonuclease VapC3 [Nocardia neocaledoniensis NBRC 108232]|uniref:Ribonuclease VapC n=1 Tax=Nocardia neocaledoniensis TaxID=236511 RepID=A0A317NB92_9NOCA|nr:type II toxin-antitoxin system VapC family toxin [Nocardia neocaledoniensis]PWV72292.1 putative nucleic acid-binding protein [Nocardia neocaledoniensis]GEM31853.1 ribonuclease VapC3 [Nocardia neocaledoniensis NBRC 108232]